MTIKSDKWIEHMVHAHKIISDGFTDYKVAPIGHETLLYYGLSSYGYDMSITDSFKLLANSAIRKRDSIIIDPKSINDDDFVSFNADYCIVPGNSFVLTTTREFFRIPRNVTGLCVGKSTYAKSGIIFNTTPLEAGWAGYITLELSNTSPFPVKIYANQGIGRVLFFESDEQCETSYAERKGKYMNQEGIQHAKV